VVLRGDLLPEILVHGLVPGRPWAKDFTKADDEGVPFLMGVQEMAKFKPFQKSSI